MSPKSVIEVKSTFYPLPTNNSFTSGRDDKIAYEEIGAKIFTIKCEINNLGFERRKILDFAGQKGYQFWKSKKMLMERKASRKNIRKKCSLFLPCIPCFY